MENLWNKFVESKFYLMLGTAFRTALVAALGILVGFGVGVFDISTGDWKGIAAVALAAFLKVVYNYFDKNYVDYGPSKVKIVSAPSGYEGTE